MATPIGDLSVRRHDRRACDSPAWLSIAPDHASVVRFGRSMGDGSGLVGVRATDCSMGGIGLASPVFVPIGCAILLILECSGPPIRLEVRRAAMTDRKPTYYIGTAFPESCDDAARAELVAALSRDATHTGEDKAC
ncbi:MAG: hypothetical protein ACKVW3_06250 [Phycisphaerales bacterium]